MENAVKLVEVIVLPDGRMDAKNAAIYLGLKEKTLAMMRSKGTGPPFIKTGGRVFYYQEDLDAWLSQTPRVTSTAESRQKRLSKNQGSLKRRNGIKKDVKRKKGVRARV